MASEKAHVSASCKNNRSVTIPQNLTLYGRQFYIVGSFAE